MFFIVSSNRQSNIACDLISGFPRVLCKFVNIVIVFLIDAHNWIPYINVIKIT